MRRFEDACEIFGVDDPVGDAVERAARSLDPQADHDDPGRQPFGICRCPHMDPADRRLVAHDLEMFLARDIERRRFGEKRGSAPPAIGVDHPDRSEEHTSELQSLMRISYAVFCLKKKKDHTDTDTQPLYTTS